MKIEKVDQVVIIRQRFFEDSYKDALDEALLTIGGLGDDSDLTFPLELRLIDSQGVCFRHIHFGESGADRLVSRLSPLGITLPLFFVLESADGQKKVVRIQLQDDPFQ